MYLAYRLQASYNVTILEARDRVGGRIHSIDGHDMGPSWVWQHHTHILSLLQELGLKVFSQYTQGDALYDTVEKLERFTPPPAAPSGRIEGSLTKLIDALKNKLTHTNIILGEEVTSIEEQSKHVNIVSKTKTYEANYVISTLPPRLAAKLKLQPHLPSTLMKMFQNTQTWMGNSAKCIIEFKEAFWRDAGLSGFVFSTYGPLGEIHDASTQYKPALFGFVKMPIEVETFEKKLKEQLSRLFRSGASGIKAIHLVDWTKEPFTATNKDALPLSTHPTYGIDTRAYSKRILFSATEFSHNEGGYLEGAIIRADVIINSLLTAR